jgi:hypothetical protein
MFESEREQVYDVFNEFLGNGNMTFGGRIFRAL